MEITLFLTLWSSIVIVVGGKEKRNTRANAIQPGEVDSLHLKSLEELKEMSTEVLRLACNRYHITSTGSREVLSTRIYQFFNPLVTNVSTNSVEESKQVVGATAADPNNTVDTMINNRIALNIPDIAVIVRDEASTSNTMNNSAPRFTSEFVLPTVVTRHTASESPRQNVNAMPPLPQTIIDKIKNGEFVNFDNLLPNRSPLQTDEYTFKAVGG